MSPPVARRGGAQLRSINHRCLRCAQVHPGAAPYAGHAAPQGEGAGLGRGRAPRAREDVSCGTAEPEAPGPEPPPRARRPVRSRRRWPAWLPLRGHRGEPGPRPHAPRPPAGDDLGGAGVHVLTGGGAAAPAGPFPDPRRGPTWALRVSGGDPREVPPQGPGASERAVGAEPRGGPRPRRAESGGEV